MFFVLSKVLNFFLPSHVLVSLGLIGIILLAIGYARAGQWMLIASIVLIAAIAILPIGNWLARPLEARFPRWDAMRGQPGGIVVLGGGVIRPENSTSSGEIVLGNTAERVIAAGKLARRYPDARVVFSGGNSSLIAGGGPIEADFVIRLFEKIGVPRDRVFVERKSRNTAENATFTKQLVMPKPGECWLLVTSAMHMPRAVGVFQQAGFAIDAYPVDYQTISQDVSGILSSPINNVRKTNLAIREWIGLLVYWIAGRVSVLFPGPMSQVPCSAQALVTMTP